MEYDRIGDGGSSASTAQNTRSALLHFAHFLESKEMGLFEACTEDDLCSVALFQEFGSYLVSTARSFNTDDLLATKTASSYLSGVKEKILKRFPKNAIFIVAPGESAPAWYSKVYSMPRMTQLYISYK
jgi:hypothetical protein